jgi:cell division protein FtsQ
MTDCRVKKRLLGILIWSLGILLFFCLIAISVVYYSKNQCREVQISIDAPKDATFITVQDVKNYITIVVDSLVGTELSKVNIENIENIINGNPFVLRSKVYGSLEGIVKINITQRTPIVRIQNMYNQSFYISEDGGLMPIINGKTARVLVANGFIFDKYLNSLKLVLDSSKYGADLIQLNKNLMKIYTAAYYIYLDPFWKAQIQQLFLDTHSNILMMPLVGDYIINLGDKNNIREKFEKLRIFIRKPEFLCSWDKYDTININFKGQIVCSKKVIYKK